MAGGGDPGQPCWCVAASFSDELLARVPPAARGRACICAACAAAASRSGERLVGKPQVTASNPIGDIRLSRSRHPKAAGPIPKKNAARLTLGYEHSPAVGVLGRWGRIRRAVVFLVMIVAKAARDRRGENGVAARAVRAPGRRRLRGTASPRGKAAATNPTRPPPERSDARSTAPRGDSSRTTPGVL